MRGVLVYFLFLNVLAAAQSEGPRPTAKIRIEVQSAGQPVEGATVLAGGVSATTNREGVAILLVEAGKVDLDVSKDAFFTASASILLEPGQEQRVLVELQPQSEAEEEVTVTATRTEKRLQDEPVRVEVLAREEIEEKMLMTPGDIVMMLNEMGGMRVQATSPSLGAASVRIQGMRGRYTRFLADGLPLFGQQVGGHGLLQIPPMDLGQVEVIKGVASALYGAGAMGGVVNLVSRRPGDEPSWDLLANRSTLGGTDGIVFMTTPLSSRWSTSLLGGGHWQDRRDVDGDGWADVAGYSRGVLRPRFFWDGGNGKSAFLTIGVTRENRDGGTLPGAVLPGTDTPYIEALDTNRYDIGGSGQFLVNSRYVVNMRAAAGSQRHTHQFGEITERDRHENLFGEVSVHGVSGRHTWVAGTAIERDAYKPRDLPEFRYTYTVPGLFIQDDLVLVSWLTLSASGRLDFHNQYGTFASPRVSALLRSGGWASRVSLGQGFFAPTPLTEETEAAGLARLVIPQPLRAERGRSISVDVTRSAGPGSYTATFFASRVSNPLHVERAERYELANLQEAATNKGLELLATLRQEPFSVTASYTYVRARQVENRETVDVPLTPRHSFGLVGMWEKEEAGRIGIECYYTGLQRLEVNPFRSTSESYIILGLLAEKRFGRRFSLFLNAENLTDVRQSRWDPILRPSPSADGRRTVDAWSPVDGRLFNGGIRVHM